jgi:hypothetical protein
MYVVFSLTFKIHFNKVFYRYKLQSYIYNIEADF